MRLRTVGRPIRLFANAVPGVAQAAQVRCSIIGERGRPSVVAVASSSFRSSAS